MRIPPIILVTTMIALFSGPALGNQLQKMPLEERLRAAEVVGVATIDGTDPQARQGTVVRLKMLASIKGPRLKEIELNTKTSFPEESVPCCDPGKYYLVFVKATEEGRYVSVNGAYGVVRID